MRRWLRARRYSRARAALADAAHVEWARSLRQTGTVCYYVFSAAPEPPQG